NQVTVLLNNLAFDGTFHSVSSPVGFVPTALTVGDFSGDGHLDLVAASKQSVVLLKGKGSGTFQAPVTISSTGGSSLITGDFNGDGRPDLAALNQDAQNA